MNVKHIEIWENKETELTSEELPLVEHDPTGLVSIARWSRSIRSV
jgi:hypothetical protein